MVIFFAWVLRIRHLKPKLVLHENVPQFLVSLLTTWLGDLYGIESLLVEPRQLGFDMSSRPRRLLHDAYIHTVFRLPGDMRVYRGRG